jgi:acetyl esterase/lipase
MTNGSVNSFDETYTVTDLDNGVRLLSGISYGDQYPNSFLDIYQNTMIENAPTFFYIHGGGFAWGDKAEGDPNAGAGPEATQYLQSICTAGYHVVSINYALAPEYRYPHPVLQIDQAIRFLQDDECLSLDMTRVVFSGGSAGGQLAGQYVNIQTNADYAAEMGMEATLQPEEVLGVVLNSALLEPEKFANTGELSTDFLFSALGRCYFGTDKAVLQQADVTAHLSTEFPPAYFTDGNYATFNEQAERLDEVLTALDIPHTFNYYTEVRLGHGYDSFLSNPYGQDNLARTLEFLSALNK